MESIKSMLLQHEAKQKQTRVTERGELMKYLLSVINKGRSAKKMPPVSMGRLGKLVQGLSVQDLYYMKSVMVDKIRRGENATAWFWWSIKPENKNEIKK